MVRYRICPTVYMCMYVCVCMCVRGEGWGEVSVCRRIFRDEIVGGRIRLDIPRK